MAKPELELTAQLPVVETGSPSVEKDQLIGTMPPSAQYRKATEPERSCSSCAFFEDVNECAVWNTTVDASMICNSYQWDGDLVGDGDPGNGSYSELNELYCADGKVDQSENLIWKTVLRTGTWRYRPGPQQKPIPKPLTVIEGHSTDHRTTIGLADIKDAFESNAIEHVTVPLSHQDKVEENTGYVRQLKIDADPENAGQFVLRAGLEFTEGDIKSKVQNGSIANTSVGLFYDYIRKDDGEKFSVAMKHVALTNSPWINGMKPFGMSEEEITGEVNSLEFAKDEPTEPAEVIEPKAVIPQVEETTKESIDSTTVKAKKVAVFVPLSDLQQAQRSREIRLTTPKVKEATMADVTELEGLELSDEVRESVTALLAQRDKDLAELRKESHTNKVNARIEELKALGLDQHPGTLKEIRRLLLADDGGVAALLLSEEGQEIKVTVSDVVERLIDALPKKDGKVDFGEQALVTDEERPAATATDENKSAEDRYREASEFLYGDLKK